MKKLYLTAVVCAGLVLSSCSTTGQPVTTVPATLNNSEQPPAPGCPKVASAKKIDPIAVAIYTGNKMPGRPYKVVGKTKVSKFNQVGIKRQEATIRDLMRKMASTLGGDAVIDINHDDKTISGTVVAYKRIMV